MGVACLDLEFLGIPQAQAVAVIGGAGQVALVDPGPATCLERLESGLGTLGLELGQVTDILLTHVHLDHAGATGSILRRHPNVRVYVHECGAEHLVRPARLIDSATRFFGAEKMQAFWGEIAAVPQERLTILRGGEQITAGGRTFDVAYTPGHAVHHVSYFDPSSGMAFVGDTGGMRVDDGYVLPPTPPPDIDLEQWAASVDRILAWQPQSLFITHFGSVDRPGEHLRTLRTNLDRLAFVVKESLTEPGTDEEHSGRFGAMVRSEIRRAQGGRESTAAYEPTSPLEAIWFGLARYWRKKTARQETPATPG